MHCRFHCLLPREFSDLWLCVYDSEQQGINIGIIYRAVGPTAAGTAKAAPVLRQTIINRCG